jgi:hypothetical protein
MNIAYLIQPIAQDNKKKTERYLREKKTAGIRTRSNKCSDRQVLPTTDKIGRFTNTEHIGIFANHLKFTSIYLKTHPSLFALLDRGLRLPTLPLFFGL